MVDFYQARLGGGLNQYQAAATDERRAVVAAYREVTLAPLAAERQNRYTP